MYWLVICSPEFLGRVRGVSLVEFVNLIVFFSVVPWPDQRFGVVPTRRIRQDVADRPKAHGGRSNQRIRQYGVGRHKVYRGRCSQNFRQCATDRHEVDFCDNYILGLIPVGC